MEHKIRFVIYILSVFHIFDKKKLKNTKIKIILFRFRSNCNEKNVLRSNNYACEVFLFNSWAYKCHGC